MSAPFKYSKGQPSLIHKPSVQATPDAGERVVPPVLLLHQGPLACSPKHCAGEGWHTCHGNQRKSLKTYQ